MATANKKLKAEELEEPLLTDPDSPQDELLPPCEAFCKVSGIAKNVVIGALFHPLYSMVNALTLGHRDTPQPLAGLGLGSLTVGLLGLSLI